MVTLYALIIRWFFSSSTVPTVVNSIARFTNVGDSVLKVKRKFKMGTDGKVTRWWYVIHAEEACLQQLESEWPKVELQTSWKLEPCYRYLESDEQTTLSGDQCPLSEGESEAAPLDLAPAVLSQRQETQSQQEESLCKESKEPKLFRGGCKLS